MKKKLFSRWILFNSSSKRLTLLIILINRLNEELKKNKQNIKDKISIIGISKNINNENIEENIADKFMKDIFFKLKEIKKDLKILDNGVTRILSIANTGVLEISCQSDKIQILRVENARRKTNRF